MATKNRKIPALIAFALAFLIPIVVQGAGSQDTDKALTPRAIAFVRTMAKGDFATAEADFTDRMKQAAPPEKLHQIWQSLLDQAGPFENIGDSKIVDQGGYTSVIITTHFKTRALGIAVTFDSAHRIAGMHFVPSP